LPKDSVNVEPLGLPPETIEIIAKFERVLSVTEVAVRFIVGGVGAAAGAV
jgi:hypothetical protein